MNVGFPWEKDVEMGAQIDEHQLEEILKYVEIGVKEGATLITGGQRLTENGLDKGRFSTYVISERHEYNVRGPRRNLWSCCNSD